MKSYILTFLVFLLVLKLSAQDAAWIYYNTSNSELPSDFVSWVATAPNGDIIIGTYNAGLAIFDGTNWTVFDKNNSNIPFKDIRYVSTNKDGYIYVSSQNNGGAFFNGTEWDTILTVGLNSQINNFEPMIFAQDGNLWAGLHRYSGIRKGYGIGKFDGEKWQQFGIDTSNTNLSKDDIWDFKFDKSGNIWLATIKGLVKFKDTVCFVYDTSNGLPSTYVSDVEIDSKGKIYCTAGYNLCVFDGTSWRSYNSSNSILPDDPNEQIYDLLIDNDDNLWLGTYTHGLYKFDGTSFINYKMSNSGIIDNYVANLSLDSTGRIWIVSGNFLGVSVLNPKVTTIEQNNGGEEIIINLLPNPMLDYSRISYKLCNYSYIKMSLFNSIGEEIAILKEGWFNAGEHYAELSKADLNLTPGIYFIKFDTGKMTITKSFVLL